MSVWEVVGCADVIPMYVTKNDGSYILWIHTALSQTRGSIRVNGGRLALCNVVLLCFAVARKVALETKVEDEPGGIMLD